jgi:hypothetical protein
MNAITDDRATAASGALSLRRLYQLRAAYLLLAVGLSFRIWPRFLPPDLSLPVMKTVVNSVLLGLSLVAFLGLRYPLRMMPLLLFEIAWKVVWLVAIGLPLWWSGRLDAATTEVLKACLVVIVFPFLIPWRHVWAHYLKAPAERWR